MTLRGQSHLVTQRLPWLSGFRGYSIAMGTMEFGLWVRSQVWQDNEKHNKVVGDVFNEYGRLNLIQSRLVFSPYFTSASIQTITPKEMWLTQSPSHTKVISSNMWCNTIKPSPSNSEFLSSDDLHMGGHYLSIFFHVCSCKIYLTMANKCRNM
jgi:hypothetical protein